MRKSFRKADILIVDDRPDGLVALEAVLDDPRINVVKANSGYEAINLMYEHDFAVILLDVQMPGIDGFETATRIKASDRFRFVPIIFVTAINKDERYVYRGYETGAVDYVFKPFEPQVLRSKVAVFVDLFLQARKIREQEAQLIDAERTERVRQLAELELEALRRYRSLADAIPHIVIRTRADTTPEYFNNGWRQFTGLAAEASVGEGWQSVVHPDDLSDVLRAWLNALITGTGFESEARFRRADGVYCWHLIRAVPERRTTTDVLAWIATATDIDDRKQSEAHLLRAKDEAESASLAKTQFLANMSHEIRTPLSAILGFTELLLNPVQSAEERTQNLATIRRNGEQLLHLINEILDISRVEAGKIEVENLKLDFAAVLAELRSVFELKAAEKGLEFWIECVNEVPASIWTDPVRFRQIAFNILSNALKFTEKGRVVVSVQFQLQGESGGKLSMIVKDTGVGIPKDRVERLFQPFSQADSSTTRRFGGTGLGLALSKKLAGSLGGDVSLLSSCAEGSVFELSVACSADAGSVIPPGQLRDKAKAPPVPEPFSATLLAGRRLLLVDDAPDNQVLISRFLRMAGAEVDLASNGLEGAEKAQAGSYDLVLMDIQMPVMDGYTAARLLRTSGFTTPMIALTAHAMSTERARCLDAGFDDHLSKPVNKVLLAETCAAWLKRALPPQRHARHAAPSVQH